MYVLILYILFLNLGWSLYITNADSSSSERKNFENMENEKRVFGFYGSEHCRRKLNIRIV